MKTILVVEDNKDLCEAYKGLLKDKYKVLVSYNGEEAFEKYLGKEPIDLVILDAIMDRMSGVEVMQKMNESNIEAKVIVVTSMMGGGVEDVFLKLGAVHYRTKPFNSDEIKELVERFIDK